MKDILYVKDSVEDWYNRNRFVYTTKFGSISELGADMNELYEIPPSKRSLRK